MAVTELTQADLLVVGERVLPADYLAPLKAMGPGYEILQAAAAVFARVSTAVARLERGSYFTSAQGGARATAPIEFYRTSATAGAFTMKAGTVVSCSRGGQPFLLAADVVFGALDLVVAGIATAPADGWEWNTLGPRVTARGEALAGDIDEIVLPFQEPPFSDPSVLVRQTGDASGGQAAMLDALAADRLIFREVNESNMSLAVRARKAPDVISPPAIIRQLDRFLGSLGVAYERLRWWEFRVQACWDSPPTTIGGTDYAGAADAFFFDDPRDPAVMPGGWRNRWDGAENQGAIIVVVDNVAAIEDFGLMYDDPGVNLVDHLTPRGQYAVGAFDLPPPEFDAPSSLRSAYDGTDVGRAAMLGRLYNLMDEITGGVPFYIELRGQ